MNGSFLGKDLNSGKRVRGGRIPTFVVLLLMLRICLIVQKRKVDQEIEKSLFPYDSMVSIWIV